MIRIQKEFGCQKQYTLYHDNIFRNVTGNFPSNDLNFTSYFSIVHIRLLRQHT